MQHAARAGHELRRIAVVVGPLEIEIVAQQRQQHAHAARVQRRQQRQRRRLAADADEGRDRPVAERAGVRGQRLAQARALVVAARGAASPQRAPQLGLGVGRGHHASLARHVALLAYAGALMQELPLALTFDDVLLVPRRSRIRSRADVSTRTQLTRRIALEIPVVGNSEQAVSAALDAQKGISEIEVEGYRPIQRAGVHRGTPRKVKGDFLGVDVNIAARVGDAADGGEVLVSEPVREELDGRRFKFGRARELDAPGAPADLTVCSVNSRRGR